MENDSRRFRHERIDLAEAARDEVGRESGRLPGSMSPLSGGHGPATIVVAAIPAVNGNRLRLRILRAVAVMYTFAPATRRHRICGSRQNQGDEVAH